MLFENREQAQLRNERHKALVARVANRKIKAKSFLRDSLILRQIKGPRRIPNEGKLITN